MNINLLEAVSYSPGEAFTSITPLGTPGKAIIELSICQNQNRFIILSKDRLLKIVDYS